MNIEKSLDIIKGKLLMIDKMLKQDQEEGRGSAYEMQTEDFEAIETLLTAYEKEKEEHKKECHNCDEYTARLGELETKNRMLKSELEKEKEKNKKAIDFINNENNYFEDGENWQNILKIKEILEE